MKKSELKERLKNRDKFIVEQSKLLSEQAEMIVILNEKISKNQSIPFKKNCSIEKEVFNSLMKANPLINKESTHYKMFDGIEAIERMEQMFTTEELMAWAKLTVFKYRLRVGKKAQVDAQSDIAKILTYESYYEYLKGKLDE